MTTTVTSSIGTASRDYSTIQAWEDASPADLTSVDQIWRGECYNDATFSNAGSTVLTVSGTTTDSTRYKELTCAAGQSFSDNASVQTNALACSQSNGVLLTASGSFQSVVQINEANFHISGLQIAQTGSAFGASGVNGGTGMNGIRADKLLVEVMGGSTSFTKGIGLYNGVLSNTQITIRGGTTTGLSMSSGGTQTMVNVTVVRVSDPGISGNAIEVGASETVTLKKRRLLRVHQRGVEHHWGHSYHLLHRQGQPDDGLYYDHLRHVYWVWLSNHDRHGPRLQDSVYIRHD